jgi:hypothetical protein
MPPPAAVAKIIRMGLVGKSCACAGRKPNAMATIRPHLHIARIIVRIRLAKESCRI